MKNLKSIFTSLLLVFTTCTVTFSQNYYTEYPITAIVANNGSLFRMECTVYDSVLQSVQSYYTPWYNHNLMITSGYGKAAFTVWITPVSQDSTFGYVTYDHHLHQFMPVITANPNVTVNTSIIVGPYNVFYEFDEVYSGFIGKSYTAARYDIITHTWTNVSYGILDDGTCYGGMGTTNWGLLAMFGCNDQGSYKLYDPVNNSQHGGGGSCMGFYFDATDDYVVTDGGCFADYRFYAYDAELHINQICPLLNIIGSYENGTGQGFDDVFTSNHFIFIYDQIIHQWIIDTITTSSSSGSSQLTNYICKDRVVSYSENYPVGTIQVKFQVFDPLQHAWVKDSMLAPGLTSIGITNGTVNWTDANGSHIRGYDVNLGWGNYQTPLFLNFHLTSFLNDGLPMIHVRNYSIGTDSVRFSYGDGSNSTLGAQSRWHYFEKDSTYSVCVTDASGMQSSCQQISFVQCATGGVSSANMNSVCEGDSVTFNLTGYSGNIQWQIMTGSVWNNATGPGANSASYSTLPLQSASYRAMVTDSICIPAYSNSQIITVHEHTVPGSLSDSVLNICSGSTGRLYINGSVGDIQWQSFNGVAWSDINSATNELYTFYPTANTQLRVVLTSGNCYSDTSNIALVSVDPIPVLTTTSDSICGMGPVTLLANSSVINNWYADPLAASSIINTGNSFSPVINTTTTYYVQAISGDNTSAGYPNNSIGSTNTVIPSGEGIRIESNVQAILRSFKVYADQPGNVTVKLLNATTGFMENYKQVNLAVSGINEVFLSFPLQESTVYDLLLYSYSNTSVSINTSGASYPITASGSPVTISGYYDGTFHTDSSYYNFYDLKFTTGCISNVVPVTGYYYSPVNSVIIPYGSTIFCQGDSVKFNAFPVGSYSYQWLRYGQQINGATGNSFTAYTAGIYNLIVSTGNCRDTSPNVRVQVPCNSPIDPSQKVVTGQTEFPPSLIISNPQSSLVTLEAKNLKGNQYHLRVIDQTGRMVLHFRGTVTENHLITEIQTFGLSPGIYQIALETEKENLSGRFMK